MKKLLLALGIIVVFLAATNPGKPEFVDWAKNRAAKTVQTGVLQDLTRFFAPSVIDSTSERKNYIIFSIFESSKSGGATGRVLGVLRTFIPLPDREPAP